MEEVKTRAIVLRTVKYGDNAIIADLLTEAQGRVSFLVRIPKTARGRVRRQHFLPLTLLSIDYDFRLRSSLQRLREMNNGKWTAIAIGYMCALAYCAALVVYQIGGLITGEVGFNFFTIVAIVIFAAFLYLMFRPNKYIGDNEVKIDVSKIK